MDGTVCVEKGARLQLVRAPYRAAERVAVVDAASSRARRGAVGGRQRPRGLARQSWRRAPDGTYYMLVRDRPRRQITLRVLDKLPADDDVLTELHRLGCKQQFEAWVREKVASGKRGT